MSQKTPLVRKMNAVFEEKIIHQTQVSLVALKKEISAKVDLRSARLNWNYEVELSPKEDLQSATALEPRS